MLPPVSRGAPDDATIQDLALAPRSLAVYQAEWRRCRAFLAPGDDASAAAWCAGDPDGAPDPILPLTPAAVGRYLTALYAQQGRAPNGIAQAAKAIAHAHRRAGYDLPTRSDLVGATLRRIRRDGRDRGRGAVRGLTWKETERMIGAAEGEGTLRGLRDAALFGVMRDALLRASEAAACTVADMSDAGVRIRFSKTDQTGQGTVCYLRADTRARVRVWLDAAGITGGRIFRRVGQGGHRIGPDGPPVSTDSIRQWIRAGAVAAGIDDRNLAGHSFRRGMAKELARRSASIVEIQEAGRWTAPGQVLTYAREDAAELGAMARYFGDDRARKRRRGRDRPPARRGAQRARKGSRGRTPSGERTKRQQDDTEASPPPGTVRVRVLFGWDGPGRPYRAGSVVDVLDDAANRSRIERGHLEPAPGEALTAAPPVQAS